MERKKPAHPSRIVDPRSTPFAPITGRGVLPHIYKDSCTYFVTFCLADAGRIKGAGRTRLSGETSPERLAELLDVTPAEGRCLLGDPGPARIVEDVLLKEQGEGYALSAWCVMPNHVHAVVTPLDPRGLTRILQSWKSVTAHRINRLLGRHGSVWQRESFDRLVRDANAFEKYVAYTENNPVAAGLAGEVGEWPFSSARFRQISEDG